METSPVSLRGYRAWLLRIDENDEPWLSSLSLMHSWPASEPMVARCVADGRLPRAGMGVYPSLNLEGLALEPHKAPQIDCSCGIYYISSRAYFTRAVQVAGSLLGIIEAWGRVVEYEIGGKSQYAYPVEVTNLVCPGKLPTWHHMWAVNTMFHMHSMAAEEALMVKIPARNFLPRIAYRLNGQQQLVCKNHYNDDFQHEDGGLVPKEALPYLERLKDKYDLSFNLVEEGKL